MDNAELLKQLRIDRDQREDSDGGGHRGRWIALGVVLVLLLCLSVGGWWWQAHRPVPVQTAVAASPGQGALLDSLGWARLRSGDVKSAILDLERAAALTPSDPDIVEHLGDAYWRAGRLVEARYQWNRVLTLDPEAAQQARVEQKLKDGGGALAQTQARTQTQIQAQADAARPPAPAAK